MRSACLMTGTTRARLPSFFSTSTARPRFTPCGSKRCGFPSTSWKAWVMTRSCFAAWTIAKPIKCVNETFFPRAASWAFSSLRRASSVSTTTSRNDVAVGTDSESVMFWTRRAAGPVMGVRPGAGRRETGVGSGAGVVVGSRLPEYLVSARRNHRQLGEPAVVEEVAPFFSDRGGVAQVLLVHHLHERGVVGAEDELAHETNLTRRQTSDIRHQYILRAMFRR